MFKYWYDSIKSKYGDKAKLCYTDTDSFIEVAKSLPIGKNRKVTEVMEDELGGKIMEKILALRPKMYSYLTDDDHVDQKAKNKKKSVIKQEIKFQSCKECLDNTKITPKF